ncbi:MAG TPA: AMP-binding protein [Candidatus Binatia bacterium]|nr:AMP-binding protein [Candidatus Binatia bacterium]
MDKHWLRSYPAGVPHEIDPAQYRSLTQLLEESFRKNAARPFSVCMERWMSYGQLDELSSALGAWLQSQGLEPGARVALMLPNIPQFAVTMAAILRAGYTCVNVNPLYTARELEHQLRDSGARAIVAFENVCATLQEVVARTPLKRVITTQYADLFPLPRAWIANFVVKRVKRLVPPWHIPGAVPLRTALARGKAQPYARAPLAHGDVAFLQYTGGTTGLSKGATLTHGNVLANLLQMRSWMPQLAEGSELIVTALPLYHIFALTVNCLLFFSLGGKNVLIANPRDLPGFVREWSRHAVTAFTGVNTLFNGLLNTPGFGQLDFSKLKLTIGGGAAVQQAVAERWRQVTGKALSEGYGLSETSPSVTTTPLHKPDWTGAIGVPLPSTWVSIRDDANRELPAGEAGELCVKGPQVMQGYWQKAEENARAFTPDGYLRTGDVALMDERGWFRIVDRKKDMVLVSGFNVYPNEIEAVLALHPGVLESACVGVPDAKSGEAVKVFVVKKDPALTEAQLVEHCRRNLTGYKVPRHVAFLPELPKSNVGKILRKELRGR